MLNTAIFVFPMQNNVFNIKSETAFTNIALDVFQHQFSNNKVYRSFCDLLYIHPSDIKSIQQIPFLPIQFFKSKKVIASTEQIEAIFTSSGTTGSSASKHLVTDIKWYEKSYLQAFQKFYGAIEEYVVLALLPNYLERKGSSLIYMVNDLINKSKQPESGFYLNNLDE